MIRQLWKILWDDDVYVSAERQLAAILALAIPAVAASIVITTAIIVYVPWLLIAIVPIGSYLLASFAIGEKE